MKFSAATLTAIVAASSVQAASTNGANNAHQDQNMAEQVDYALHVAKTQLNYNQNTLATLPSRMQANHNDPKAVSTITHSLKNVVDSSNTALQNVNEACFWPLIIIHRTYDVPYPSYNYGYNGYSGYNYGYGYNNWNWGYPAPGYNGAPNQLSRANQKSYVSNAAQTTAQSLQPVVKEVAQNVNNLIQHIKTHKKDQAVVAQAEQLLGSVEDLSKNTEQFEDLAADRKALSEAAAKLSFAITN